MKSDSGPIDVNGENFRRLERANGDVDRIDQDVALVESEERYILSSLAGLDGGGSALNGRDSFLSNPETLESLKQLAFSKQPVGQMNLGPLVSKDELIAGFEERRKTLATAGDVTLPAGSRVGPYYGVSRQLRRRLSILDLIPTAPMDNNSFDYAIESGSFAGPAETSELAMKPTVELTLTDATVYARTVAAWVKTARQGLADYAGLATTINGRLGYAVEKRVEDQILAGNGVDPNLLGILSTSGIGVTGSNAGNTVNADQILDGIGTVLGAEANPNAIVLNPADWLKMLKVKATTSGERLDSGGAFSNESLTLWGYDVVLSTAITAGHALVGDFTQATLFIREGISVRISDSDQDDFTKNRVTALAETRVGLAVWQPSAFTYLTLSFAA